MEKLIEKIGLETELKNKVLELLSKDRDRLEKEAYKIFLSDLPSFAGKDELTRLAICLIRANELHNEYKKAGICDEIYFDTMRDISIWCENNKNKGLKNTNWIKNHLTMQLFKIGRLQFQIYPCKDKHLNYDLFPFDYGENLIYVHIPQGEKLLFADCLSSLREAVSFFDKYFGDYHFDYFFCESWLLFEDNWMFMPPDSNILQFQTLFSICENKANDHQAIERIFGKRHLIKSKYPENTRLQRGAKEFIMHGGKMGEGIGVIHKNELK